MRKSDPEIEKLLTQKKIFRRENFMVDFDEILLEKLYQLSYLLRDHVNQDLRTHVA